MGIEFVLKSKGYGVMLEKAQHSPIVMEVVKDMYGENKTIIDSIKFFYRSHQHLSKLYEMIGFYDRTYSKPLNSPLFSQVIAEVTADFTTPRVETRTFDSLSSEHFTLNTSPGMPYVRMGFRQKGECYDLAVQDAKTLYHSILSGHPSMPWTMIFARTGITTKSKNKLRGVWGKPFSALILEHLLYRNFLNQLKDYEGTPNGYKFTVFRRGYMELFDRLTRFGRKTIVGLDFSKYDTSLPPWLLRIARGIWSRNINMSESERKVERYLLKQTIDTTFIMPDGFVFRKNGGTDSGSLAFQRDEDVATSLIVKFLFKLQGRNVLFYSVLGDDSICVLDTDQPIDMDKLASDCLSFFGIEINKDKSYQTLETSEAKFLGRYVNNGIPKRDTIDFVLSALYPRRTDKDEFDVAQRIVALAYENCYSNDNATAFLNRVWRKLSKETRELCENSKATWAKNVVSMFRTLGLEPPPIVAFPTFEQIFDLLYIPKEIDFQLLPNSFHNQYIHLEPFTSNLL